MVAGRSLASGLTAFAVLAALTGCRDILGFQESTSIQAVCASSGDCLPNESCSGQACHAHCRSASDCQGNEVCATVADVSSTLCMVPGAGAADASVTEDAGPGVAVDGADSSLAPLDDAGGVDGGAAADVASDVDAPTCDANLTSDPGNCGSCGNPCAALNVCIASGCHPTTYYGRQDQGNDYVGVAPNTFSSIQLHIGQGGWATAIGIVASESNPDATAYPNAYLGIYADTGGGSPGVLVATIDAGSPVRIEPGRNEFSFSPPVAIGTGYYWLAGIFDGSMPFAAEGGVTSTWNYAVLPSFQPLPTTAPAPNALSSLGRNDPNFYLVLAQ